MVHHPYSSCHIFSEDSWNSQLFQVTDSTSQPRSPKIQKNPAKKQSHSPLFFCRVQWFLIIGWFEKTLEKKDRKHWIMHDRLDHMGILSIQNVHPPTKKKSCCAENLDTGRVNEAIDVPWPKFSARRSEGHWPSEFSQQKYIHQEKN